MKALIIILVVIYAILGVVWALILALLSVGDGAPITTFDFIKAAIRWPLDVFLFLTRG